MNVLELFAGARSLSKVAELRGHSVFTLDMNPDLPDIDYCCDILDFEYQKVPFIPDVIWASPDCSTWSKASGNIHYDSSSLSPKTEKAILARRHVDRTLEIIKYYISLNHNLLYYIENPVGRLKQYIAQHATLTVLYFHRLDQCQYGREYKKPTDIFSNDGRFVPKRCQGNCGHKPNLKNCGCGKRGDNLPYGYYERAKIATKLCEEILISAERQFNTNKNIQR